MNQFIQRIANYVANELIIKGLANSRTFQRIALRTHNKIEEAKKVGSETLNTTLDEIQKEAAQSATHGNNSFASYSTNIPRGPPRPPPSGISGFFRAFGKEIQNDLGLGRKN
mmetsp:Transcript_10665/g.12183  ORF Transcript_10665/g.12183 Transcript_10665/m.12183 type:complete len:112 (+) Transcript_10665:101-436(+)